MNCPICNIPLAITERQGIEIDYCPQCRGVWLDRGELDKIIERSTKEISSSRPYPERQGEFYEQRHDRHHDHHHDDHHSSHYKKKRGFLHDLFD